MYNESRASAGVLITQGQTQILVDMGAGVDANLHRAGVDDRRFDALMFTHHHVDHNAEFISLLTQNMIGRSPFAVYGPTNTTKFTETFLDLYKEDFNYRLGRQSRTVEQRAKEITVKDLKSGDSLTIDAIKVTALAVPHSIETLAYRFDYKEQSIVITGDLTYTDQLPAFAQGADCMIIDSGGMKMVDGGGRTRPNMRNNNGDQGKGDRGKSGQQQSGQQQSGQQQLNQQQVNQQASGQPQGNGNAKRKTHAGNRAHLGLEDSSLLAQQSQVKNLVYTHFLPGTVDEQASLAVIRQNYAGTVTFGEDLMSLSCGNSAQ
jgi:ribonuclease BN (tRNA processing enzyme)